MSKAVIITGTVVLASVGYGMAVALARMTEYAERVDLERDPRAREARTELLLTKQPG